VAFVICAFWLIEALAAVGPPRRSDRDLRTDPCCRFRRLGLLSEDYDPAEPRMWGNFPQTYSHVGLIHSAFAASPQWNEVL
jgi:GH15 family glucan-1,4-alpha-glucosidase